MDDVRAVRTIDRVRDVECVTVRLHDGAGVSWLPATLRVEDRTIQNDAALRGRPEDARFTGGGIGIVAEEESCRSHDRLELSRGSLAHRVEKWTGFRYAALRVRTQQCAL